MKKSRKNYERRYNLKQIELRKKWDLKANKIE